MKSASGAQISPDGRYVAYVVTQTNWEENDFVQQIWIAQTATGERYQLTSGKKSSSGPQWSPDSRRLAFVSDRDGKRQIYLIAPGGGEAAQLTTEENGVSALVVVARRIVGRVHFFRRGREGEEGPEGEVRRFRDRRRGLHDESPVAGARPRRSPAGSEAASQARGPHQRRSVQRRQRFPGRPTASASHSAPAAIPTWVRRTPSNSTSSTWPTVTCANCWRRRPERPAQVVAGRQADRVRHFQRQPVLLLRESPHRGDAGRGRRAARRDRSIRRRHRT